MAEFLSPEWISALDEAATTHPGLKEISLTQELLLGYRIVDGPSWRLTVGNGEARVYLGTDDAENVWFMTDRSTALDIALGTIDPLEAIIAGKLEIGGDPRLLVENHEVFKGLGDVFASCRPD